MHGDGVKRLDHPVLGQIELEYSAFAVDGRPDLGMIIYNPVSDTVADYIRALVANQGDGNETTHPSKDG